MHLWAYRVGRGVAAAGVLAAALLPAAAGAVPAACSGSTFTVTRISSPVLYLDTSANPAVNSAYEGYQITNSTGSTVGDVWVTSGTFSGPQIGLATYSTGRSHLGAMAAGATQYAYFYLTAAGTTSGSETHTVTVYSGRPDLGAPVLCATSVSLTSTTDIAANANKVTAVSTLPAPPQVGGALTITITGDAGTIGSAGIFATTPASYAAWRADSFKLTGTQLNIAGNTYQNMLYLSGLATGGAYTATFTFAVNGSTASSTPVSPMSHISSGSQVKHTAIDSSYTSLPPIQSPVNQTTLGLSGTPSSLPPSGGTVAVTVPVSNQSAVAVTLDDITFTPAAGETISAGSAAFNSVTVADPASSGGALVFVGQFTVPGGGSRSLTFTLSVPASQGSYAASVVGHVASTQIDTTAGTTDNVPATMSTTVLPAPTVVSVSPSSGSTHGGTAVTITGTNFAGVSAVSFGSTAAASYTVVNATSISATTPAVAAGVVDVRVTTGAGTSATSAADQYTYVTPPNSPPVYTGAATNTAQSVVVGGTLTALAATDADSDPLTFTLTGGSLPAGVTLGSSGTFAGTVSTAADTSATIQVADGQGGTASTTLAVHAYLPPTIAIDGGASVSTSDSTPTISGTTDAGADSAVTVTVDAQSLPTTVTGTGTWTVTVPVALADGTYTVTATVVDEAGNPGSATQSLTVDTTAPVIAISGGASVSTSDSTPVISGTTDAAPGATVTVTVDVQSLTATVSGTGTWTVTVPVALSDGPYTVSASVADALGNVGTATQSLTVDTTVPVIAINGGASVSTSDSTPTMSGTTDAVPGAMVTVTVDVQSLTATVSGTGTWTVTVPVTLSDGPHTVSASVADAVGNIGTATQSLTVDTTAPVIAISGGASVSTSDSTPTISGTTNAAPGAAVTVTVDVQSLTATVSGTGTWAVTVPIALTDGTYTVTATVGDAVGNVGTATQSLTVDTTAPSISIDGGATVSTSDSTPTISGTTNAAPGATVTVTVGTQSLTATVGSGTWTVTVPVALVDGAYTVTASVADVVGNVGTATQALTVDTIAPVIAIDGGAAVSTSDSTPDIAGTTDADPGATVTVSVDVQSMTATVSGSGTWTVTVPVELAEDSFTVTASVADAVGNVGTATQALTVALPHAPDEATVGSGTSTQAVVVSVPPGGGVVLLDSHGNPTTQVVIPGQGRYDLDPATGRITFTPVLGFTGTATPVRYRVSDAGGVQTEATYMPAVVAPPGPSANRLASAGMPGERQSVTITLPPGGHITLLDAHGHAAVSVVIDGQGRYDVQPSTGVIEFTPLAGFAGLPTPVRYLVVDAYGQGAVAMYAPFVAAPSMPLPGTGAPIATMLLLATALIAAGIVLICAHSVFVRFRRRLLAPR